MTSYKLVCNSLDCFADRGHANKYTSALHKRYARYSSENVCRSRANTSFDALIYFQHKIDPNVNSTVMTLVYSSSGLEGVLFVGSIE